MMRAFQSGRWLVLVDSDDIDEAQASGRWVKGETVEVPQ